MDKNILLTKISQAAEYADELGLQVNAGHGLNRQNLYPVAAIPFIKEFNIGHALIADSLFSGLEKTLQAFIQQMYKTRSG